ncbi:MAG: methyltransferase domain-containing protein [Magnetococcales bacterium]|nr:methyltransferase domain-containing protein [Magnetococcales bacterium]MBF0156892.1 methyltransferase domain-containing protein [Magnetococcales bacterium]
MDAVPAPHLQRTARVERLDFIDSRSVELIYASHVLEHFGRFEYLEVLREWYRVLKPGGILRLSVPDFAACATLYYEQGLRDGLSGLVGLISGGQRSAHDFHRMIFDRPLLTWALAEVGFAEIRPWDWRATEHARIDDYSQAYLPHLDKEHGTLMSLNLEGIKGL